MKLHFEQYSTEGAPLVILHGLYGNGGNWATHARQLAGQFAVYTFDARNHGFKRLSDLFRANEKFRVEERNGHLYVKRVR